jgi:endo-1,3(4)-beta-glucanase
MPGPIVWRLSTAGPFAATPPPFASVQHPVPPSSRLWSGALSAPFPTNRWFEDAVLPQLDRAHTTYPYTPDPNYGDGESPFSSFPYMIVARSTGLVFALNPITYVQRTPPGPYDPANPTTIPGSIIDPPTEQMRLGALEPLSTHVLTAHDYLSCELSYAGASGGSLKAPLVEGMPYVTVEYDGLTPVLAGASPFLTVNGSSSPGAIAATDRLLVTNGVGEEWVVYASPAIALSWEPGSIHGTAPFHGVLRAALVKSPQPANSPFVVDNDLAVLDANRGVYPKSATVDAAIGGDQATVTFTWNTVGSGDVLMLALPHHQDRLSGASVAAGVAYPSPHGTMQAVQGNVWTLTYALPKIDFAPPRPIDPSQAGAVRAALANDLGEVGQQAAGYSIVDPYDAFRRFAAFARIAQIADELGDLQTANLARQGLEPWTSRWLEGNSTNDLVYDTSWGGIVVQGGLQTADYYYYNGYYNDHHFHYGYMIYSAAVTAKPGVGDAAWLDASKHREAVTALVRDIANPSTADPYFPPFRMFDWFFGHSWTLGILHDGRGRDQESSSEAVNAWYAVSLYGQSIGDDNMQNVGRLLAGMEIAAAQKYYQIPKSSTVYPPGLSDIGVAANPHSLMVDFETYFGLEDEYMYGIEALPFTPISEALLDPQWIADRYDSRIKPRFVAGIDPDWVAYMYMMLAVADPKAASEAMTTSPPPMYLWGNSQTNTLWFLATRPR